VAASDQAWRDGQVERAEDLAGRAAKLNPSNAAAVAALDRVLRKKGQLDAVLGKAGQALAGDDFDEVAALLNEAGKINPRAAAIGGVARQAAARKDVLARVGRLLAEARDKWDAGEVEAALSLTGRALDLDPNHAGARAERERMVSGRDRLIAALKQSASFLAAKRFDSAAGALGEARTVNARFPAIAEMEQAIAARKDRAWRLDERLARARDQWNAGDADGALGTLTEATALDPEHAGAVAARKSLAEARDRLSRAEDRAEAALEAGNLDATRAALAEAGRICPRHPRLTELAAAVTDRANRDMRLAGLRAEANRRLAAGDLDGAVSALDAMLAQAPGEQNLVAERDRLVRTRDASADALRRATDYLAGRRYDLALAALAEAEKAHARTPGLGSLKQRILTEKGKAETSAATWLAEAKSRLDKKDFPAAREAIEAAKKTGPLPPALEKQAREAERRLAGGLVHQEAANREQAARDRTKTGTADAERRARCAAIGQEAADRRTAGDHAGAIRSYQTLLQLCPDTCQAYNNVGASLFSLGYLAEAVPWFDEAVKCAPSERLFKDNAAMTRTKLAAVSRPAADTAKSCAESFAASESRRTAGDLAGAIQGYRGVIARCPDFCAAYNNLGLSLHKLGRPAESLPLFEQALRCNPKDNLFRENYDLTAKRLRTADRRP
jgi:cellulose synthase operon protein C